MKGFYKPLFPACIFLALTSSCGTMSIEDCQSKDWQRVGYELANSGRKIDEFDKPTKKAITTCTSRHKIDIDKSALYAGYSKGLRAHCSHKNGYKMGGSGKLISPLCNKKDHKPYFTNYNKALKRYCTYHGGYDQGISGGEYLRNCPKRKEANFLRGLDAGRSALLVKQQTKLERTIEESINSVPLEENDVRSMESGN